jgi:hypothetical protein
MYRNDLLFSIFISYLVGEDGWSQFFRIFDTEPCFVPLILKRFRSKRSARVPAERTILGFVVPAEL